MKVRILGNILTASVLLFVAPAIRTDFAFAGNPDQHNLFEFKTDEQKNRAKEELQQIPIKPATKESI
jgi:hypothetical protein